ncbi:flavin reductase family protein [Hymenobacter chitinivorans]|uniref:Flavin reductase (DIM6/NTAB) family NADH-FMN oxidoreductase RutF n=1 Tax=Hymenobacter chitinivorans DSM 11115 TaxID=1121954 RepID=A0A2M9BQZ1_9BACT|nr:flavin reductase family protein [Hymenobacter chitinivorans]PJJ60355.1 flavin reductase (DIM6/NTAB) family NADH-FMN oxidoreductase RutF [Hymenobacter chitinivorans DSM 11115]
MHQRCEPAILYFGTPVVLISTTNEDGTVNLAPMSSIFWLGWRAVIGLSATSQTTQNLLRMGQCVLNLPSVDLVGAVNRLALTTGSDPVPVGKQQKGYRTEREKFELAGLTPMASETVAPPRVLECPVQLEAVVAATHGIGEEDPTVRGRLLSLELRIQRVHVEESILLVGHSNRVDPDKWRPLLMSFQHFYGLGPRVHESTLAQIPEALYRSPDVDRARQSTDPQKPGLWQQAGAR